MNKSVNKSHMHLMRLGEFINPLAKLQFNVIIHYIVQLTPAVLNVFLQAS